MLTCACPGEDYNVEEVADGPRPFRALLDTGLKRTSTGSKVFAALKVWISPSQGYWAMAVLLVLGVLMPAWHAGQCSVC